MRDGQLTLHLTPETRAQLAASPAELRTEDGRLVWLCPHCDHLVVDDVGETEEALRKDPACGTCRAHYHGLTIKQVAARAASGAPPESPPAGWRRKAVHG